MGDSSAESPPLMVDVEEERVKGCVKGARCVSLSSMKATALVSARRKEPPLDCAPIAQGGEVREHTLGEFPRHGDGGLGFG